MRLSVNTCPSILGVISSILISTTSASCIHGTTLFQRSVDDLSKRSSTPASVAAFGYTERLSAFNWANLSPLNHLCSQSKIQSPINLSQNISFAPEHPSLNISDVVENAKLINLGTNIEVEFADKLGGYTVFGGQVFRLVQFHFHTPSEHRVDEEFFPVEIHMVHENVADPKSLAVLAPMFQLSIGCGLPFLDTIVSLLPNISTRGLTAPLPPLHLSPMLSLFTNTSISSFTYAGSLTTPPCSEGVTWLIPNERLPITVGQFNALKSVIKFNSRYTQNALGDGNLVQIAAGNDTMKAETEEQMETVTGEGSGEGVEIE